MRISRRMRSLSYGVVIFMLCGSPGHARHGELPNRIPEAAPYNVTEAEVYLPPMKKIGPQPIIPCSAPAAHYALDGAGGATGGRPAPTTEAGRWRCPRQRIQRAHEVVGKSGKERGRPKNSYTRCWLMRRHGWDSEDLQTPVSLRKVSLYGEGREIYYEAVPAIEANGF